MVTGAGVRVGRAIALALGRAGARVAVHYNASQRPAEETCEAIVAAGGDAFSVRADLLDRRQARHLVEEVLARTGRLDTLVPSAANFEQVAAADVTDTQWDDALALNTTAPWLLAQGFREALAQARGSIVFVTCSSTQTPFRGYLPYVVSKAATRQLMRALALELAPEIRVNAVAPGTVLPPSEMSEEARHRLVSRIPLARTGHAQDIADATLYLATAEFVTGHELLVDGGRSVAAVERYG